jgi:uncharacterized membrane protein YphA (DoxX/SURF4 family)
MLTKKQKIISWALQIIVALILFQTLFFKFTGAEESKYIFSTLGLEPYGRIGSGIAELIAVILLLIPATVTLGAILSVGVISGAIFSHLTKLGIVVQDDGGLLFALALSVFVGSLGILAIRRRQVPLVGHWFRPRVKRFDGKKKRVLILGGGFGGMYAALALEKTLARDADVEITLVNRENFFLFTPMLHEVAASDLDLTNIVSPVRKLLKRVRFFAGDVESIDLNRKTVTLSHGTPGRHDHEMPYDYLVLGLGSVTNLSKPEGLAGRVLTMKSLGDAIALRNRIIARLEEADTECAGALRQPLMTFVVVGGGFAGVETIGAVNDFVRDALRHYPNVKSDHVRMMLVHSGQTILPELGEELGRYADRKLRELGVEIRTGARVASVGDDGVILTDATVIDCCRCCHASDRTAGCASTNSWSSGGATTSGRSATARSCPTFETKARTTRPPRSTRSARESWSRTTLSVPCAATMERSRSTSRRSGNLRRSAGERVWRRSTA